MTIAKSVAWVLVLLCVAPITAPFSVRSAMARNHAVASSRADDDGNNAIALERSTFHNECRACAGAAAIHAVVVDVTTFVRRHLTATVPGFSRPARAVVLRV